MTSSIVNHMEKMSKYRLTGKTVKIENLNHWVHDIQGEVLFENDKGVYVDDTIFNQNVFVPWSSIAVLKIKSD